MFNPLNILDTERTVGTQVVNDLCSNYYDCYTLPILWSDGHVTSLYELLSNKGLPDGHPIGINIYNNKFIGLELLYSTGYYNYQRLLTITEANSKYHMNFFTGGRLTTDYGIMSVEQQCKQFIVDGRDNFGTCLKLKSYDETETALSRILKNPALAMVRHNMTYSTQGILKLDKEINGQADMDTGFQLTEELENVSPYKNLFDGWNSTDYLDKCISLFNAGQIKASPIMSIPVYLCSIYNEGFTHMGDWYLPSIGELLQVYAIINQIIAVQNTLVELNCDYKMYMFDELTWFWSSSIVSTEGLPAPLSLPNFETKRSQDLHMYILNTLTNAIRVVDVDAVKVNVLPIIDLDHCSKP